MCHAVGGHADSTGGRQLVLVSARLVDAGRDGATSRDFGAVSVADRKHAANNPKTYLLRGTQPESVDGFVG